MRPADVEELLAEFAPASGVVGAAVGVARGDEVAVATYGFADTDGTPVTPETRFAIASVTKPMVATVVARLAGRGALDIDEPVSAHVKELATTPWANAATVRQLLANGSGIPLTAAREWLVEDNDADALARFCDALAGESAMWPAGTVWSYCNSGWSVLGRLIECVTGEVWEDAMRAELITPLDLSATEFGHEPSEGVRSRAFEMGTDGPAVVDPWLSRALGPGGASVFSTVGDLLRFGQTHCDDDRLALLRDVHARVDLRWFLDAWCLGWARFDATGGPVWGWDGIGSGFRAILRIVPDERGVVALVANTSTGRDLYRDLVPRVFQRAFGIHLPAPPREATGSVDDLQRYEGRFAWPDFDAVVTAEANNLRVHLGGDTRVAHPIDERNFVVDSPGTDRMTIGFSQFHGGAPQVLYNLVWGLPRVQ